MPLKTQEVHKPLRTHAHAHTGSPEAVFGAGGQPGSCATLLWGCLLPGRLTAAPAEGGGHWDVHMTICQVTSVDDSRELETETQDSNMSGDSE